MKTIKSLVTLLFICAFTFCPFLLKAGIGNSEGGGLTVSSLCLNSSFVPISISTEAFGTVGVSFAIDCGVVDVLIEDESGLVVYGESVDTSIQSHIVVHPFNLPSGSYSVVVVNSSGELLAGQICWID